MGNRPKEKLYANGIVKNTIKDRIESTSYAGPKDSAYFVVFPIRGSLEYANFVCVPVEIEAIN